MHEETESSTDEQVLVFIFYKDEIKSNNVSEYMSSAIQEVGKQSISTNNINKWVLIDDN